MLLLASIAIAQPKSAIEQKDIRLPGDSTRLSERMQHMSDSLQQIYQRNIDTNSVRSSIDSLRTTANTNTSSIDSLRGGVILSHWYFLPNTDITAALATAATAANTKGLPLFIEPGTYTVNGVVTIPPCKIIANPGSVKTSSVFTVRNIAVDDTSGPANNDMLTYFPKADSLIVLRQGGATANLRFSYKWEK